MNNSLVTALLIILGITMMKPALSNEKASELIVFSYHDVLDNTAEVSNQHLPQTITRERLIEHFNLIDTHGYHPISFQEYLDAEAGFQQLPEKAVMLVFDDGYRSFYDTVYPLLKLYDFPAVSAVVGSWLDVPEGEKVSYGNSLLPRESFMSWQQLQELQEDPLVEIASHTYDMHYGVSGNPQGNEQAVAVTSRWQNGQYESEQEYLHRVRLDMERATTQLKERLGTAPRLMVWPYGAYSEATLDVAAEYGMPHSFSLQSQPNKLVDGNRVMGRYLVDQEISLQTFKEILDNRTWEREDLRIVHVDLDYVYDSDPDQQERNLDILIDRIYRFGVSTVYLQAFADQNGNGVAEALYFENRHLPVKADLFNRVAWQLKKRANVKVYAWMPVLAFDLGPDYHYVTDARIGRIAEEHYLRLSPYSARNREVIKEIYQDLGRLNKFDGLLFHDDAFMTDFEDSSPEALEWYSEKWSLPGSVNNIRNNQKLFERWTDKKIELITDFTLELADAANYYRQSDYKTFTTSRNLYAITVMEPESKRWFSQTPENFAAAYDYVAVMAMPLMEEAEDPETWLDKLAQHALSRVPRNQLVFELQTQDWRNQTPIDNTTLIDWIKRVRKAGIPHIGYYPDDFHNNHPDISKIGPHFSLSRRFGVKR